MDSFQGKALGSSEHCKLLGLKYVIMVIMVIKGNNGRIHLPKCRHTRTIVRMRKLSQKKGLGCHLNLEMPIQKATFNESNMQEWIGLY